MDVVYMTFNEYDDLLEKSEEITFVKENGYFPTLRDIEKHEPSEANQIDPKRFIIFLAWLLEKNPPPETYDELESHENIKLYLKKHLVLADSEREIKKLKAKAEQQGE